MPKIWYASPNGDWWEGQEADYVYVLREEDLPEDTDIEAIEGDKFEKVIMEHGKAVEFSELYD